MILLAKYCAFLPSAGEHFECTSKFYNISYDSSVFYTACILCHFTYIINYIIEAKFCKISQENCILWISAYALLFCAVTFLCTLQMPSNRYQNEFDENGCEYSVSLVICQSYVIEWTVSHLYYIEDKNFTFF